MTSIQLVALFVSLAAALAYLNARVLRLPSQVGMLVLGLAGSLAILALDAVHVVDADHVRAIVGEANFSRTLLDGMLGLLLFAGALHVDREGLRAQRWPIAARSLGGTVLPTLIVGVAIAAAL